MSKLQLPSYLEQSPGVKARFDRLKQREVILDVRNLNKVFDSPQGGITALRDINFQVHRRELLCIIGPSGCGKSTLVRILAGLETPTSGEILLDGEPKNQPGPERGMVFQGYTLFPWLTVKKNVMFGLQIQGHSSSTAESEAMQWVEMVGLSKFANHYPDQLSGGMKQRVAIARTLANQPRILLMDEPFGALDAQTRTHMQSNLFDIWRNIDITIAFITHDLDEAIYLADRILVLKANPGEVHELIEVPVPRPRTTEQFISPEFLATRKRLEELIHPPKDPDEEEPMSLVRMARAGDYVDDDPLLAEDIDSVE